MFSPISIREFFKFPSTNSLASIEPMISLAGTMGSAAGISSVVLGKYNRTPAGDMWLIAENVSVLLPLIMQSHDLSSSLTRISIILFEGSEFAVGKLSALHPLNRATMDAIKIISRICLAARVILGIIILNLRGFIQDSGLNNNRRFKLFIHNGANGLTLLPLGIISHQKYMATLNGDYARQTVN